MPVNITLFLRTNLSYSYSIKFIAKASVNITLFLSTNLSYIGEIYEHCSIA